MTDVLLRTTPGTTVRVVDGTTAFDRIKQLSTSIAQPAYEIFEHNGRISGCDADDWFRAEAELFQPIHVEIAESP